MSSAADRRNRRYLNRSRENVSDSATEYETVDVSSADAVPGRPFKGINVLSAGIVVVTGLNGVDAALYLNPGFNPAGGKIVRTAGTGVTDMVLCF